MKKVLFIHIPKTAGSTLKVFFSQLLDGFYIQANSPAQLTAGHRNLGPVKDLADIRRIMTTHTGLALHVDSDFAPVSRMESFRSLAPCLFDPANVEYFSQFTILMMLRHPLRRFVSDYAFVRRTKQTDPGFLSDLELTTIEAYLDQIHPNPMLHFLLEPALHKPTKISRTDLERVKERMRGYPIHTGIFERFDDSMSMFARVMDRTFSAADVPTLNAGTTAPAVDPAVEAAFYERNALDMELYEYAVEQFDRGAA